jgi:lipopolysaccharide/colanic/teichoic acid biosynthesis glycosyltransferase
MAGATLFAFLGADQYLNGDRRFVLFTALTIGVHLLFAAARGHLAGWRRFRAYGMASGSASLVRLAVAIGVTLVRPSATGFALGLILGPLVVLVWKPFRRVEVDREELDADAKEALDDRGLLTGLVLAAASSQALLLAGPLAVGLLGGSAVEISIAFAAFTLGRAPLTFGYNLLARVLPPFTEMAAKGERQELRAWARGMGWAATGLALIAAVMGWLAGPWVVEIAFGADFAPSRLTAAAISFGVVFAGGGLFVGQILVARGESVRLAIAWLSGLVSAAAAVVLASSLDPVTRVAVAFVVGEILALVALVAGAVISREGDELEKDSKAAAAVAKRTLDIAVALVLGVLTIPVVVLAGIAVRINSSGPIFFRQIRLGKSGKPFGMLKIRTMEAGNDERVFAEHLERMEASRHSEMAPMIRIEEDDRVTSVGHFLRRWSIDELPNLWNVLRGPMSLVGPRPLVSKEAEMIGLDNPRFEVKPGITGLAQVEGRDTITMSERTHYDEVYVETRSVPLDIRILIRTFTAVFRETGD